MAAAAIACTIDIAHRPGAELRDDFEPFAENSRERSLRAHAALSHSCAAGCRQRLQARASSAAVRLAANVAIRQARRGSHDRRDVCTWSRAQPNLEAHMFTKKSIATFLSTIMV